MKIEKYVEDYLRDKYEEREREIGKYYVSDIPYCIRKTYLRFKKPKPVPREVLGLFEAGKDAHEFVRNVLEGKFEVHKVERPVTLVPEKMNWRLDGRLDHLVVEKEGKEKIVEVKSAKNLYYINCAKQHHIDQNLIYMKMWGAEEGEIIYLNRSNYSQIKRFPIELDEERIKELIEKTRRLHNYLKKDELPPAEAEGSWECSYTVKGNKKINCPYYDECIRGEWND